MCETPPLHFGSLHEVTNEVTRVRDPSPPFRVTSRGGPSSDPCARPLPSISGHEVAHQVTRVRKVATTARAGCSPIASLAPSPQGSGRSWVTAPCPPSFFRRLRAPVSPRRGAAASPLASAFFPQRRNLLLLGEALRRRPEASFFPRRGAAESPWLQLSWRRRVSPRDDVPPHSLEEAVMLSRR